MPEFLPKRFLFTQISLFVISLAVLVYIIFTVNPDTARLSHFTVFYLGLFLTALSGFTLGGYLFRAFVSRNNPLRYFAKISLRQGLLLAFLVTIIFLLQSLGSLTLLSVFLLVLSLTLLESAFLTRE